MFAVYTEALTWFDMVVIDNDVRISICPAVSMEKSEGMHHLMQHNAFLLTAFPYRNMLRPSCFSHIRVTSRRKFSYFRRLIPNHLFIFIF